ncbi:hypothetical protein BJY52DRAFT_1227040 [Lactarius psammicola]|nr:hypothetical protein BJY52DRAFT_1227040 [Lactarius psammicola]
MSHASHSFITILSSGSIPPVVQIMTTKVPNYVPDYARLAEDTERPTISENTSPSLIHVSTRSTQVDDTDMDLTPKLGTSFAKSEKPGKKPGAEFDTQIDGTNALLDVANALEGGFTASQYHVSHDTAIQQPKPELTREDHYALRQEVRSALRRIVELERRMGIVRDDRSLRRERIQLGLEIVVADNQVCPHSHSVYIHRPLPVRLLLNRFANVTTWRGTKYEPKEGFHAEDDYVERVGEQNAWCRELHLVKTRFSKTNMSHAIYV